MHPAINWNSFNGSSNFKMVFILLVASYSKNQSLVRVYRSCCVFKSLRWSLEGTRRWKCLKTPITLVLFIKIVLRHLWIFGLVSKASIRGLKSLFATVYFFFSFLFLNFIFGGSSVNCHWNYHWNCSHWNSNTSRLQRYSKCNLQLGKNYSFIKLF